MIATTYTTTPTVRYEFDAEDGAWYGHLVWNGPDGEVHRVSLANLQAGADRLSPADGEATP